MRHNHTTCQVPSAVVIALALASTPVSALTINFTDVGASKMTAAQLSAFEEAAAIWMGLFDDPITVNVNIAFESLGSGILGSTSTARTTCPYVTVCNALLADAGTSAEKDALADFPTKSISVMDINGDRDDDYVTLSTANAKALGLSTGLDTTYSNPPVGVDAEITFSTVYEDEFDYDRDDGIDSDKSDFVAVAAHELGHALGFFSLTDTQDLYPTYTLHPNTLDLWRFPDPFATADSGHNLARETRCVTSWFSDFYSDDDWHVPFSLGAYAYLTDYACNSVSGSCQASHWSDDQGNLMDPTLGDGYQQDIKGADVHAVDYIGYDTASSSKLRKEVGASLAWFDLGLFELNPAGPDFAARFDAFPPAPDWSEVPRLATATMALRVGLQLGGGTVKRRSAVGYARYQPSAAIEQPTIKSHPDVAGEQNLLPARQTSSQSPAALFDVILVTEDTAGSRFTFRSAGSTSGSPFDASLGEFGGYRLAGFVDGVGDGIEGDIDGALTMVLLAESLPATDRSAWSGFTTDSGREDDVLIVHDRIALGLSQAFRRGDANGDGVVSMSDAIATLSVLFLGEGQLLCHDAADSNDDGHVTMSDAITTLSVLFLGVGAIPAPGIATCGEDPTEDDLPCSASWVCR